MYALYKIMLIRDWAEYKPWFDTTFIDALEESYYQHGDLTENQESALKNIIYKFKIGRSRHTEFGK